MDIQYVDDLGSKNINEVLAPTNGDSLYRTLSFVFRTFNADELDRFNRFLDDKIVASELFVSGNAVVMVKHDVGVVPKLEAVEHIIMLICARILTCNSVRWTFTPHAGYKGFGFEIILPVATSRQLSGNLFDRLKRNEKPTFQRREKKQGFWSRVLMRLGFCRRKR